MTLYHFGNCIALVYVPYYMTYKYSGLSEYGAFYKCCQAGGVYIFTQFCKMLLLATFFPDIDSNAGTEMNIVGEFFKSTFDLADILGLYLVLSSIPGIGHSKILTAGLGWASAEVVLTRALLLWFGARGSEFDWQYIQKCLESNISLIQHLTTTALVWLWTRHDLNKKYLPLVTLLLIFTPYKPLLNYLLISALAVGPWLGLVIKSIEASVIGVTVLSVYSSVAQNSIF